MQREPAGAVLPWLKWLNAMHGSFEKFMTSLNVFTTGTEPCQICTIVDDNDNNDTCREEAYKQLCDSALHMPICASSTVLITHRFLELYKSSFATSSTAVTPIHITYHFQLNVCHANCCAGADWTHRAAAMAVLGKAIKMIAQDAEFSRRAEEHDDAEDEYDESDKANYMSISCRDVMELLTEYKSTVLKKCSCRLQLQLYQPDPKNCEVRDDGKEMTYWCSDKLARQLCKKERFVYLTTLADPRESFSVLHGSQKTKTECELCNLWPWHKSEFENFEVDYQAHKCSTGKPINALFRTYITQGLATTINVGKDHLCKHYITDPLCTFNRYVVNTTHRPCVNALVATFLYKLAQRCGKDLEAKKTVHFLDVLSDHYLIQHKEIQSEIW